MGQERTQKNMTKKELEEKKEKAELVCSPCGRKYGRKRFFTIKWIIGTCDMCEAKRTVTVKRDFKYLRK